MNINKRFETIEDVLAKNKLFNGRGGWFGFSDIFDKSYENLIIHNKEYDKPTKDWLESELKKQQSDFDAQAYARNRQAEYPTIAELTVALYDTDDKSAIESKRAEVKKKYPKP